MSTTQKDKSGGKPRQRNRADQRGQKTEAPQSPKLERKIADQISPLIADAPGSGAVPPAELQVAAAEMQVAPAEVPLIDEVAPAEVPLVEEVTSAVISSIDTAAPAQHRPISIQTIANAYENYTKRSFQQSRSFVEKLMGVRSFDKAIEVQTEFATLAYANFVAESQKICELYNELARQIFMPWQRFTAEVTGSPSLRGAQAAKQSMPPPAVP